MRPLLRYHGGKWRLAPWIISHFPAHRIYTEAFGGAASVLLQKPRCYGEIYNDLSTDVVNLFRVLRDPASAKDLANQLRLTPFAREEFELAYVLSDDPVERARRLVVRSFMGFGSTGANISRRTGFRGAAFQSFTAPARDWAEYPDALGSIIERLRGVVIENRAAASILRTHDAVDCLHYVDPPYVHSTRANGDRNYEHEMSDSDHQSLAETLHGLSGMVVLSGYRCALYDALYDDWVRLDRDARADRAAKRIESIWLNDRAASLAGPRLNFGEQQ